MNFLYGSILVYQWIGLEDISIDTVHELYQGFNPNLLANRDERRTVVRLLVKKEEKMRSVLSQNS